MIRKCLKEYYIILGRLEKVDWLSKEIIFDLLSVDSKETLDYLVNLDNDELREALEEIGSRHRHTGRNLSQQLHLRRPLQARVRRPTVRQQQQPGDGL